MRDRDKDRERNRQKWHSRRLQWLRENGPCRCCGSTENLELDHIDRASKARRGDSSLWTWSESRRAEELAKCQVLCRRCHLKKTGAENLRPLVHGSYSGYVSHGCRCEACTTANREWARRYHARRRQSQRSDSNGRPPRYERGARPLSYAGEGQK